jgi:hypothetical protein
VGILVAAIHPQPPWSDAATFAEHYHPVQLVPYWFGLALLASCVFFVARAAAVAEKRDQTRVLGALITVAMYAAMVGINYTMQVAWVPQLVRSGDPLLGRVTMANPAAAAWALEMFGYGALGIATWLIAPVFARGRFGSWVAGLFVANGVVSVVGAVVTGIDLSWVKTLPGLIGFAAWNALFIVAMSLCAIAWRPSRSSRSSESEPTIGVPSIG